MSEPTANIYTALVAAQSEFGTVTKGATNSHFKNRYADLADVANAVIPTLSRHGVCVLHYLVGDDLGAMRTEFVHAASGTRVACDVKLIVNTNNMQGMKSATTYAKRIGLESLSGVAPEDDDGNAAVAAAPPKQAKPTPQEIAKARADLEAATTVDQLRATYAAMSVPVKAALKDYATELSEKLKASPNPDLGGDEIPDFGADK